MNRLVSVPLDEYAGTVQVKLRDHPSNVLLCQFSMSVDLCGDVPVQGLGVLCISQDRAVELLRCVHPDLVLSAGPWGPMDQTEGDRV